MILVLVSSPNVLMKRWVPGCPRSWLSTFWIEKVTKGFDRMSTPNRAAGARCLLKLQ
jgi:hypothetical protein